MASSNSSNYSSSSKNYKFNSFLNLSRSNISSNILQVEKKPKQLKSISDNTKRSGNSPKKLKWYDVKVKNLESGGKTLKKPRSSIPIVCKNEGPQTSCCIRITNLTRNVTIDCLREIFSGFGTIKKLDLHFNIYDSISTGFSYIMFSTSKESENAVKTMNRSRIDGHEIICDQWLLPYTEYRVSSILRGACSGVGYLSNSSKCILPICNTEHSSQLDVLRSYSRSPERYKLKPPSNSTTSYDYLPPNQSLSGSSRRSCSRSPRQSRLGLDSSLTKNHSRLPIRSHNRYSRKPYELNSY